MARSIPVAALLLVLVSTPARAELIDLGSGLIYDTVQDLTWLQDAMYAQTSGYDSDGRMMLADAVQWTDSLVYGGFDDWRLPRYISGFWQTGDSEITRMVTQLGWHQPNPNSYDYVHGGNGPFLNFPQNTFWLSGPNYWWSQFYNIDGADAPSRAWAVRDGGGPVAVPEPSSAVRDGGGPVGVPEPSTLLLLGLGSLFAVRNRLRTSP